MHSMLGKGTHQHGWGQKAPESRGAGQAGGAGSRRCRDLLWRRECTEGGTPGTVAAMHMTFREE